jgi:hypothetical protein
MFRATSETASAMFLNATPMNYEFIIPTSTSSSYSTNLSQTRRLETRRRQASQRYDSILQEVVALELKMGVTRRWEPTDREYLETLKYMSQREYHRALDNLQRLVVLRLFELHKLNISQTGMNFNLHV